MGRDQHPHHHKGARRGSEPRQGDAAGIRDGNHDDRADVVDHGDAQKKRPDGLWHPASQYRQHREREGDIGGHRNAPARLHGRAGIDGQVDAGGEDHAAQGSGQWQCGRAAVRQLADRQLPLDLQPDEQEEQEHERVIHHGQQVGGEYVIAQPQRE